MKIKQKFARTVRENGKTFNELCFLMTFMEHFFMNNVMENCAVKNIC